MAPPKLEVLELCDDLIHRLENFELGRGDHWRIRLWCLYKTPPYGSRRNMFEGTQSAMTRHISRTTSGATPTYDSPPHIATEAFACLWDALRQEKQMELMKDPLFIYLRRVERKKFIGKDPKLTIRSFWDEMNLRRHPKAKTAPFTTCKSLLDVVSSFSATVQYYCDKTHAGHSTDNFNALSILYYVMVRYGGLEAYP
ncbi:hypothetical protein BJ684DRAFT_19585 [Piptocephalis cylindrospora]|uniref:Uncharacterized protein n=1 Tax=Piptocephalis cylindrospora TaxID=1907219 RepID=A0A4P9Y4Z2_9FUNG|nr:hypothetical protein BJ684DRAFT_19585 [Piptocephalis cylindrospora]|eukprot:RKP13973.1 hypothetical protein BJ684DRAFT_19585 [Piptocephalis cylindrospora]